MVRNDPNTPEMGNNRKLKIVSLIALIAVIALVSGLYILQQSGEKPIPQAPEQKRPESILPSRPEEVWSYIKDLETREIPVNENSSSIEDNTQLTEEQKRILKTMEAEQKAAEAAKLAAQSEPKVPPAPKETITEPVKKPQPQQPKSEPIKKPPVVVAEAAKPTPKPVEKENKENVEKKDTAANNKKFGLQCGAFRNRQQAEALQARLTMAGFNSRLATGPEWNRVFIGPIGDRAAAAKTQERAKSIINCVVISM